MKINVQLGLLVVLSEPPSVRLSVGRFLQGHDDDTHGSGIRDASGDNAEKEEVDNGGGGGVGG